MYGLCLQKRVYWFEISTVHCMQFDSLIMGMAEYLGLYWSSHQPKDLNNQPIALYTCSYEGLRPDVKASVNNVPLYGWHLELLTNYAPSVTIQLPTLTS